jgi:hypothetical protein
VSDPQLRERVKTDPELRKNLHTLPTKKLVDALWVRGPTHWSHYPVMAELARRAADAQRSAARWAFVAVVVAALSSIFNEELKNLGHFLVNLVRGYL